ncbi:MAG: hypothetical protein AAFZ91_09640 [Pseudomonadota bacterium]
MSLIADGRTALQVILQQPDLFPRVKESALSRAAITLAKPQIIAGGMTLSDHQTLRTALGSDTYDSVLDTLSAYHVKLLVKRIDKTAPATAIQTADTARAHVRVLLTGESGSATPPRPQSDSLLDDESIDLKPVSEAPSSNRYFGRKSFRTRTD